MLLTLATTDMVSPSRKEMWTHGDQPVFLQMFTCTFFVPKYRWLTFLVNLTWRASLSVSGGRHVDLSFGETSHHFVHCTSLSALCTNTCLSVWFLLLFHIKFSNVTNPHKNTPTPCHNPTPLNTLTQKNNIITLWGGSQNSHPSLLYPSGGFVKKWQKTSTLTLLLLQLTWAGSKSFHYYIICTK